MYNGLRTDTTAAQLYDAFRKRAQLAAMENNRDTADKLEGSEIQDHSLLGSMTPTSSTLHGGAQVSEEHKAAVAVQASNGFVDTERPCMLHPVKVSRHHTGMLSTTRKIHN